MSPLITFPWRHRTVLTKWGYFIIEVVERGGLVIVDSAVDVAADSRIGCTGASLQRGRQDARRLGHGRGRAVVMARVRGGAGRHGRHEHVVRDAGVSVVQLGAGEALAGGHQAHGVQVHRGGDPGVQRVVSLGHGVTGAGGKSARLRSSDIENC